MIFPFSKPLIIECNHLANRAIDNQCNGVSVIKRSKIVVIKSEKERESERLQVEVTIFESAVIRACLCDGWKR